MPTTIAPTRYFASATAQQADLADCTNSWAALHQRPIGGPQQLLDALTESDALLSRLRRHIAYAKLMRLQNIDDLPSRAVRSQARALFGAIGDWIDVALSAYGEARFLDDAQRLPGLAKYAYRMHESQDDKAHRVSDASRALLDALARPAADTYWSMYQHLEAATPFGTIDTAQGPKHVRADFNFLQQQGDRAIRQRAWQQYWGAYGTLEQVYADALIGAVQVEEQTERMAGYPDAVSATYQMSGLTTPDVQAAFEQVRAHAPLIRRFHSASAMHLSQRLGIASAEPWDAQVSADAVVHVWSLDDARALALRAIEPLGKDYRAHMAALLDPANGRTDIAFDKGRRGSDNTPIEAPGLPTGLFVEQFRGLPLDIETIAHEGGHAVHRQYMYDANVSAFYSTGPVWLSEGIATLNSYLVYDHLVTSAPSKQERIAALETLMRKLNFELFQSAQEGMLELAIYRGVNGGQLRDAAQLNALAWKTWSEFDDTAARHPEIGRVWMARSLYFHEPNYYYNYLYSGALAVKMFSMLKHDPVDFARRFLPMLRDGYNAPPAKILEKFFGHPVAHADLIKDAMAFYAQQLHQLELLYAAE